MKLIWSTKCPKDTIILNMEALPRHFKSNNQVTLYIGSLSKDVKIQNSFMLSQNVMIVPHSLGNGFTFPDDLDVEVKFEKSSIIVGPAILLITPEYYPEITEEFLKLCEVHIKSKKQFKGLFYVCQSSGINIQSETITGYCFVPTGSKENQWIKGVFPYPQAVFNRTRKLDHSIYESLKNAIGDRIFNSDFVGKWKQYKLFSANKNLKLHLPETRNLTSKHVIYEMLDKYKSVYLKPHNSANGKGIFYLQRLNGGYLLQDTENHTLTFPSMKKVANYFRTNKVTSDYLVQQPIPFKHNNRNLDFRFYMQKNKKKKWTSPGFTAKISKENSINTNFKNRDLLLYGMEALKSIYNLNQSEALEKANEMFSICRNACETIEMQGIHLGDVAFDLILDQQKKTWILELQIRYGRDNHINKKTFKKLMTNPIEYAKVLAGF
ncbi:YheC/YheD family protein [Bacillus suaedaesalsae]|uniref:YheC/YheD family protein n=1 Tax=Bacillus suaedaesalsae TaxID=2810349 RepID=A0ABS2DIB1_9BACI|nr:YheC/YheD family protein [Bacillus suaedaesalsae]MBM6618220.1 YheC/YheD family protein [Bacillus suaedaesalsae]